MEELLQTHQRQVQDLQARIAQKKKNATKKTRKGVNDECAALERQLAEKQHTQLEALSESAGQPPKVVQTQPQSLSPQLETSYELGNKEQHRPSEHATRDVLLQVAPIENSVRGKKPNRQKARLARRATEQQAVAEQAAAEAADLPDQRQSEREIMDRELEARRLLEKEVRSDGHCMYAAVADQMRQAQILLQSEGLPDYRALRRDAASFIESHRDDFAPFLEESFADYVVKVRDTAEWGGHLELTALARAYGICIQVLRGDGRVETISCSGKPKEEIWLAYYRHSFGLGEHYNSLHRKP